MEDELGNGDLNYVTAISVETRNSSGDEVANVNFSTMTSHM